MLRNISRFAAISCAACTVVGVTYVVGGIMPSLSQSTPERNSGNTQSETSSPSPNSANSPIEGGEDNRKAFIQAIKQRVPGFYTFDELSPELKARAVRKNGMIEIKVPKGEAVTLPNGDRFEADGSMVKKNGVKFQPVMKDGKFLQRYRIFKPDGTELKPGEKYIAPDGMSVRMKDGQEE